MQFSKNLQSITFNEKQSVAGISFGKLQKPLLIKVGISAVSTDGAKANLQAEISHWDFEKTKAETTDLWEKELSKIIVEGKSEIQKEIFYTALYHSLLTPNLYIDVDGNYNGTDLKKNHTGNGL